MNYLATLATINKTALFLSGISVVGLLLAMAFFVIERDGKLQSEAQALRNKAQIFTAVWLTSSLLQVFFTLSTILDVNFSQVLEISTLTSFIFQIELGRFLFAQSVLIALLLLLLPLFKSALAATTGLFLALFALILPVFQSHSAANGSHQLAIGSLAVHVIALSLWVGGILSLLLISSSAKQIALPRFSAMALWAAIAVVVSGATNAWVRLNFQSAWSSSYARIVILKIILTALLIFLGYRNRQELQKAGATGWKLISRVLAVEAVIMAGVVFLGSWLSQLAPPEQEGAEFSPATSIVGFATPAAPTISRILLAHQPDAYLRNELH